MTFWWTLIRMVIRGWDLELASARSMRLDVIFRCSMKRWARHQSYHYIHHLLYNMMSKDKDWAYHIFPEQRLIIIIFDFLKVHNELGKVKKFWTSRPLFSWRNSHLKKVQADSAPPRPNRVKCLISKLTLLIGLSWFMIMVVFSLYLLVYKMLLVLYVSWNSEMMKF